MADFFAKHKASVCVALIICLGFLFSSTGYLAWLQNLRALAEPDLAGILSSVCGYLTQALGIGVYMLVVRMRATGLAKPAAFSALVLSLAALIPATVLGDLAPVVAFGLLANLCYGVIQGFYLVVLCTQVDRGKRGTVFGCAYGVSTLLSWLLSLVGGGFLVQGLPSVVCCAVIGVAVAVLVAKMPEAPTELREPTEPALPALDPGTFALACVGVVLVFLVKSACFAFPVSDLDSGIDLELSRTLYGLGLALLGVLSDRSRRLGLAACAISLALPFCLLALSSTGASAAVLWVLGYVLTSIYALFGVLLTADYAEAAGRPYLACLGLLLHRVGLALGTALALALTAEPQALIAVTAVLLIATAVILIVLDQRLFAQKPPAEAPEPPELQQRRQLERFSAAYGLSARERDVLPELISGKTNAEIAAELFVTERTVKFHVHNIMEKTGCANRLEVTDLFNASA